MNFATKFIAFFCVFCLVVLWVTPLAFGRNADAPLQVSEDILIATTWEPIELRTLKCLMVAPGPNPSDAATLRIVEHYQSHNKTIWSESPGDSPLSAFVTSDLNSRLVTIWTSGSAFAIRVYAYDGHRIRKVLEAGAKAMPEFVFPTSLDLGEQRIIIPNLEWDLNRSTGKQRLIAVSADVYKWDGSSYRASKGVPWKQRFR